MSDGTGIEVCTCDLTSIVDCQGDAIVIRVDYNLAGAEPGCRMTFAADPDSSGNITIAIDRISVGVARQERECAALVQKRPAITTGLVQSPGNGPGLVDGGGDPQYAAQPAALLNRSKGPVRSQYAGNRIL